MVDTTSSGDNKRLREQVVKSALATLDWDALKEHFEDIVLSRGQVTEACCHIRRSTDLICKYPRKDFERRRARFLNKLRSYAEAHFGVEAANEIDTEVALIERIEQGYRNILNVLEGCAIGKQPATVRVGGSISLACYEYQNLLRRGDKSHTETKELNLMSGIHLQDDDGNTFSVDAVIEGLSESVAMTLIMEAYKNSWFDGDVVVLPELPKVGEERRFQSGATQVLALFWRQWQRVEKRCRFLGGELRVCVGDDRPAGLPDAVETLIDYIPPEEGLSEREVYDYLANIRLQDRLVQTFMGMEVEYRLSEKGVGISDGAVLPPKNLVSGEEAHAGVSLSETLGYSIVDDDERPGGIRLLEWVRGYAVLKEIARSRTAKNDASGDDYAILLTESELINILQACGLEGDLAPQFIALTCLQRSSRDMFDCPLVRVGLSSYLLFAPSVIDLNISRVVLSNLSNRGADLGRKGKAFEQSMCEVFRKRGMDVFAFKVHRDGQEFEYDAVVPWEGHLFVFECKNRSLSGNDPVQTYYFDLEVASQAKQVRRLADALAENPDIIEQKMGAQYVGMRIVPCVLHSLPYSRIGDLDGVYFTDASALTRFFDQPYFRIKVLHRIGATTLLHRTAIKKLWKGEEPTVEDFLKQLEEPFQLELSLKHLDVSPLQFVLSESEIAVTYELVRTEMTARSVCEAVGVDADKVLQEIALISEKAAAIRTEFGKRAK